VGQLERGEGFLAGVVFEFQAQDPIEVEALAGQKFFQVFAARGVELGDHFAFLHVHQDATRSGNFRADQKSGQSFGTLAGEASQTMLR